MTPYEHVETLVRQLAGDMEPDQYRDFLAEIVDEMKMKLAAAEEENRG
jgi:polyhydroxyalkanoate synthesis regulator phasin